MGGSQFIQGAPIPKAFGDEPWPTDAEFQGELQEIGVMIYHDPFLALERLREFSERLQRLLEQERRRVAKQ